MKDTSAINEKHLPSWRKAEVNWCTGGQMCFTGRTVCLMNKKKTLHLLTVQLELSGSNAQWTWSKQMHISLQMTVRSHSRTYKKVRRRRTVNATEALYHPSNVKCSSYRMFWLSGSWHTDKSHISLNHPQDSSAASSWRRDCFWLSEEMCNERTMERGGN